MLKSTKIVATIGPATESVEIIEELILAGMNVARFNTKHGTVEWHAEVMRRVREVAGRLNAPVGILLDLQGPEIRITIPGGESFEVGKDEEITFTANPESTDPRQPVIPQIVIDSLAPGNKILIDDGLGELSINHIEGDRLWARALNGFTIANRKTLNTPGVSIPLPSLLDTDLAHLDGARDHNTEVEFVGLSFVRNQHDINILRQELEARGLKADIVAKIENQSSVDNLDEIIAVSDVIMIARGDLAVEVPFQELSYWQKLIIKACREKGKPVITATQMLKSMVEKPRPTRAEVSDIANAIYDGTDAVMLSEETTIGKYPVEAVKTQAMIANFNEDKAEPSEIDVLDENTSGFITHAGVFLLKQSLKQGSALKIDKIVCLTESGRTARLLARYRPHVEMHVLTSSHQVYHKLSILYGAIPHMIELLEEKLESSAELMEKIKELGIAVPGESVLLIHGTFWRLPGLTNTLSLLQVN